jgi:hypothetical protein
VEFKAFVIFITTYLKKKRNRFNKENDKGSRMIATASQFLRKGDESLESKKFLSSKSPSRKQG